MVAALGGPADVLADAQLPRAPEVRSVAAPRDGAIAHIDTRALGLAVVALGGGRDRPGDAVDPRVGLAGLLPLGTVLRAGEPLLQVHAATPAAAEAAERAVRAAITLADAAPRPTPVVVQTLDRAAAAG
jgi:thymidine phosphorylase